MLVLVVNWGPAISKMWQKCNKNSQKSDSFLTQVDKLMAFVSLWGFTDSLWMFCHILNTFLFPVSFLLHFWTILSVFCHNLVFESLIICLLSSYNLLSHFCQIFVNFCYIFVTFWKMRDLLWSPVPTVFALRHSPMAVAWHKKERNAELASLNVRLRGCATRQSKIMPRVLSDTDARGRKVFHGLS